MTTPFAPGVDTRSAVPARGRSHGNRHIRARLRLQGPLVETLTAGQLEVIAAAARPLEYKRRARIYVAGDPGDNLFVVTGGVVKLSVVSAEGRELILGFLHPGDAFGELAVVDDQPRDHMAEAYEDCVVHAIGRDVIGDMMRDAPALSAVVHSMLADRLRVYRTRLEELLCRSALARVAHSLSDLARRHGVRDTDGIVLPLRLSQRDLGNMVGLTRETVNFVLKELRQRQLIEVCGRSIRIRAPEALLTIR